MKLTAKLFGIVCAISLLGFVSCSSEDDDNASELPEGVVGLVTDATLADGTEAEPYTFDEATSESNAKLKIEWEDMTFTGFESTNAEDASGGVSGKLIDENSRAEAIITFPAGSYIGYVYIKAPDGKHDAFYVRFGDGYTRCFADDPVPDGYAKTSRTPIKLYAPTDVTVKMIIQKDSPETKGEDGMYIDYVEFTRVSFDELLKTTSTTSTNSASQSVDFSSLPVGSEILWQKKNYLVTKNSFYSESNANRSAFRAADTDEMTVESKTEAEIEENVRYINKYLTKEFRAKLLEEELGITDCVELFSRSYSSLGSSDGIAFLRDEYNIFDQKGNKVAKVVQSWNSGIFIYKFFPFENDSDEDACAQEFMKLKEDTIREYDPHNIDLHRYEDNKTNKHVEFQYHYYKDIIDNLSEDDERYKQIDIEHIATRKDYLNFTPKVTSGKISPTHRKETYYDSGDINYCLLDNSSRFATACVSEEYVEMRLYGDGKVNGSTNTSDYCPAIFIELATGEIGRTDREAMEDESIYEVTPSDETITIDEEITTIDDTQTINITVAPVSITYCMHFQKVNGNYPAFDKYAKVTLYFNETERKYEATQKSIDDFLNAYIKDFPNL